MASTFCLFLALHSVFHTVTQFPHSTHFNLDPDSGKKYLKEISLIFVPSFLLVSSSFQVQQNWLSNISVSIMMCVYYNSFLSKDVWFHCRRVYKSNGHSRRHFLHLSLPNTWLPVLLQIQSSAWLPLSFSLASCINRNSLQCSLSGPINCASFVVSMQCLLVCCAFSGYTYKLSHFCVQEVCHFPLFSVPWYGHDDISSTRALMDMHVSRRSLAIYLWPNMLQFTEFGSTV